MGIGPHDLQMFKNIRANTNLGNNCAILGNCTFWFGKGTNEELKEEFKKIMNFDIVDTFDINGNPDYIVDLQEPLPDIFYNKYDWVLDIGTLYCIFDICSAWKNMYNMGTNKCCMIHCSNLVGHYGRGFYALSPSIFNEFYQSNNFTNELYYTIKSGSNKDEWIHINNNCNYLKNASESHFTFVKDNTSVRYGIPCDSSILCIAITDNKTTFKKIIPQHYINTNGV